MFRLTWIKTAVKAQIHLDFLKRSLFEEGQKYFLQICQYFCQNYSDFKVQIGVTKRTILSTVLGVTPAVK